MEIYNPFLLLDIYYLLPLHCLSHFLFMKVRLGFVSYTLLLILHVCLSNTQVILNCSTSRMIGLKVLLDFVDCLLHFK